MSSISQGENDSPSESQKEVVLVQKACYDPAEFWCGQLSCWRDHRSRSHGRVSGWRPDKTGQLTAQECCWNLLWGVLVFFYFYVFTNFFVVYLVSFFLLLVNNWIPCDFTSGWISLLITGYFGYIFFCGVLRFSQSEFF